MEMSSVGSPLMTLAAFAFTMLLSFSSSVVLSESTSRNPSRPPPFHPPPSATKNGSLPRPPRPLKENHGYWHHPLRQPPPPSDKNKKYSESSAAKKRGLNTGKLVGLVFAGIIVVLQIGAVSFLAYKRNQLYKVRD